MKLFIGVLAIQGAFAEHEACLMKAFKAIRHENTTESLDLDVKEIRTVSDIAELDGLILPGGESTTMGKFLERNDFKDDIKSWMNQELKPVVWGTCAGLILLANKLEGVVKDGGQSNLGGLDVTVSRNYFGRQINSFEAPVDMKLDNLKSTSQNKEESSYHGVFIRAPAVCSCDSDKVEVLGTVKSPREESSTVVVAVKQGNVIATAFHPELTEDTRWHEYFLRLVTQNKVSK